MFRGATARTLISILAAVLLALPFFTPTSPFAQAHTARQVEAKAQPGIKLSGKTKRDQIVTLRDCDHSDDPTGPLRTREGHRAATSVSVATAPQEPERVLLAEDPAAAHQ